MRPRDLETQVAKVLRRGYRPVTFTEAVTAPPGQKVLAVTFDDGFASVAELGKPILDRLGVPGTLYAVSRFAASGAPLEWAGIDEWRGGPHDHELRGLDWDALRRLADDGWEIGAHTVDHPRLTALDDEALARQLTDSRAACEAALQRPCTSVAYPYGDTDARVERATAQAGYAAAAALPARWYPGRPLSWPRVGVYREDDLRRFTIKISRAVRALRTVAEPRVSWRGA